MTHDDVPLDPSNVAYTDNEGQEEMSHEETFLPSLTVHPRDRMIWVGPQVEVNLRDGSGRIEIGDTEHSNDPLTVFFVEAFPEPNEGKYVAIFDELTRQWATRRNSAT